MPLWEVFLDIDCHLHEKELMVARRKGQLGMDLYILLYFKWITNKDLLYSAWNSAQYYVAGCMGGKFWGK